MRQSADISDRAFTSASEAECSSGSEKVDVGRFAEWNVQLSDTSNWSHSEVPSGKLILRGSALGPESRHLLAVAVGVALP